MEGFRYFWKNAIDFLTSNNTGESAVGALQQIMAVTDKTQENISWIDATLPRARTLIDISESWCFLYKPMEDLLPKLKEAVKEAQTKLEEFDNRRQQASGGANWTRFAGELVNDLKNWMLGFPENVERAKNTLERVSEEMDKTCSMLNIPQTPNQFREHISMLRGTLPRARLLIERSECWRFRYKPIDKLLPQLKEAVYNAEYQLDDIESKKKILEGAEWRIQGEVLNYLKSYISGFAGKVESTREVLDKMCNEMENLCNQYKIPGNPNQFGDNARPITTSDHPKIYGRDKDLEKAICSLRVPRSASSSTNRGKTKKNKSGLKEKLAILPIVGMGGVGKTTLAQMIYNDERVKSYYSLKAWICVSDQFDVKRLTKEIYQCATNGKDDCNTTNLNLLQQQLKEVVKSKRVLLVLDDIWSEDWHRLVGPISEASEGSAVILTTRKPEYLQCSWDNMTILDSILLEGLEEKIYWDFFKSCAGLDVTGEDYGKLEDIAKEICSRLKGSPLAAKTLGGLLRKTVNKDQWIYIRDSKMWELEQGEHDIIPVLQLSYQHLPSRLKKCLSFCSLYPKDHEFSAIELAKLWIMESLIKKNESLKHMEDKALSYFQELKNGCFFLKKTTNNEDERWKYEKHVIHDLMHDVCQSITTGECYCLEDKNFGKNYLNKDNFRHLSIFKKPNRENTRETLTFKNVHSLLVASPNYGINAIKSWCQGLTFIRRLSLSKSKIKGLPENIGHLKHLHYLDISNTPIQMLPDSFCTLYNLQHLDMWSCDMFLEYPGFPNGSNKLTGLQYFRPPLQLVHFLTDKPNLVRAMQLYDLEYDVVKHGGNKIENLKHLTGVRGSFTLSSLGKVFRMEAVKEAELDKQEFVDTLRLHWDFEGRFPSSDNEIQREVLDGLHPHPNLSVLEISKYTGSTLAASWMGGNLLTNLRRVSLSNLLSCSVSQLPRFITELEISLCSKLTSLNNCLRPNLLPKLECINISGCNALKSLPVESFFGFESLEKLCIEMCHELTCPTKMVLPPSIKVLKLSSCGELENSIPSCLENLSSLEKLTIIRCPRIVSIPDEVMRNLKSLKSLSVAYCPNLISLGNEEFLKSIKKCDISSCPKRKKTWGKNPYGRQLSDVPSSSNARKRKARARK